MFKVELSKYKENDMAKLRVYKRLRIKFINCLCMTNFSQMQKRNNKLREIVYQDFPRSPNLKRVTVQSAVSNFGI